MNMPYLLPALLRCGKVSLLATLLGSVLLVSCVGCGSGNGNDNQVPDNPAPLPDPSKRIEG